ncbi:hypothetical protein HK097_008116 [Rhizophlyctis rosea]|uniref:NmrA-like domain-containing protein n=1 Tax=Rhizophlyctis rosea TaxID=64517 RepID=A0AAD5SC94_9FUNG|nr:hypothetical protein HK097_008116 [Rhizophlyctis rosea]
MTAQHKSVLIFGATGNVGSAAAQYAAKVPNPPKIILALRDVKKPTPGLPADQYPRIHADLSDAGSLERAARESGATAALVYITFGAKGDMKPELEALVRGGIKHIVLLSSASVQPDNKSIKPTEFIAHSHAIVELAIESLPIHATFVRPGAFTTNTFWWSDEIKQKSSILAAYSDSTMAYIDTTDIGNVCASVLVNPPAENHLGIYLEGPKEVSVREAAKTIGEVVGREVRVEEVSEEEFRKRNTQFPKEALDSILKYQREGMEGFGNTSLAANVEKWTGKPATTFRQFVERNKQRFL